MYLKQCEWFIWQRKKPFCIHCTALAINLALRVHSSLLWATKAICLENLCAQTQPQHLRPARCPQRVLSWGLRLEGSGTGGGGGWLFSSETNWSYTRGNEGSKGVSAAVQVSPGLWRREESSTLPIYLTKLRARQGHTRWGAKWAVWPPQCPETLNPSGITAAPVGLGAVCANCQEAVSHTWGRPLGMRGAGVFSFHQKPWDCALPLVQGWTVSPLFLTSC